MKYLIIISHNGYESASESTFTQQQREPNHYLHNFLQEGDSVGGASHKKTRIGRKTSIDSHCQGTNFTSRLSINAKKKEISREKNEEIIWNFSPSLLI